MTKRVFVDFVDEVEYDVDDNNENEIVGLACGCYACDGGIQPGHFLCSSPPAGASSRVSARAGCGPVRHPDPAHPADRDSA